ncbi:uncharacterized protein RJT21DRAFT_122905 [Scheffersomyces amazonensis]|uniref:uncharacterized protein n=1 Tax=Scheffersomyces amazonensis TaxID=1078765 RepID=UPI00315CCE82
MRQPESDPVEPEHSSSFEENETSQAVWSPAKSDIDSIGRSPVQSPIAPSNVSSTQNGNDQKKRRISPPVNDIVVASQSGATSTESTQAVRAPHPRVLRSRLTNSSSPGSFVSRPKGEYLVEPDLHMSDDDHDSYEVEVEHESNPDQPIATSTQSNGVNVEVEAEAEAEVEAVAEAEVEVEQTSVYDTLQGSMQAYAHTLVGKLRGLESSIEQKRSELQRDLDEQFKAIQQKHQENLVNLNQYYKSEIDKIFRGGVLDS